MPLRLQTLPCLPMTSYPTLRNHPLIGTKIKVIQRTKGAAFSSTKQSLMMPSVGNPDFPPRIQDPSFRSFLHSNIFRLKDFLVTPTDNFLSPFLIKWERNLILQINNVHIYCTLYTNPQLPLNFKNLDIRFSPDGIGSLRNYIGSRNKSNFLEMWGK